LLISGQIPRAGHGLRSGYYHENDQLRTCATCVKWTGRAEDLTQIVPLLDQAFAAAVGGRPGPALLEGPLDVLREETAPRASPRLPPWVRPWPTSRPWPRWFSPGGDRCCWPAEG